MNTLQDLEQKYKFWHYFFELSKIPRPSRQEEKACAWVLEHVKKWNLSYTQDSFGNISISVPANDPALEHVPVIALQGHLDMVCEKDTIVHDFQKDGLKLRIHEDTWITATSTTLGADNGIAIAYQMALMDPACEVSHGPLEMLMTLDEETGLNGASNLGPNMISAGYMINIDNSQEGVCCIGCAGGRDYIAEVPIARTSAPEGCQSYSLEVAGLAGGHSGAEIYDGRSNALLLLERVLSEIRTQVPLMVSSIEGGNKHNAIPRSASAVVHVTPSHIDTIKDIQKTLLPKLQQAITSELIPMDRDFSIALVPIRMQEPILPLTDFTLDQIITIMRLCPNGVIQKRHGEASGPTLSSNFAAIHTHDTHILYIYNSRFANKYGLYHIDRMLDSIFKPSEARVHTSNYYDAWEMVENSSLETLFGTYYESYNKKPITVDTIHGGIECGIIKSKQNHNLEVICIGPLIEFLHSPRERMHIQSTENMWNVVSLMLAHAEELQK